MTNLKAKMIVPSCPKCGSSVTPAINQNFVVCLWCGFQCRVTQTKEFIEAEAKRMAEESIGKARESLGLK